MKKNFLIFLVFLLGWGGLVRAEDTGGLQPVRLGKKFGFIDGQGTLVLPAEFDWAWPLTEGRAGVRSGKYWFLLDERGQRASAERYDWVGPFGGGLAPARLGLKWGYIGRGGGWKIEPYFSDARPFREGVAAVQVGGKSAIIYKTDCFEGIVPALDLAPPQTDLMVPASAGGKWGLINVHGGYVLEPQMDEILEAKQGRIPFRKEAAWGFLDLAGNVVVPAQYLAVAEFDGDWAAVKKFNGTTGFVNLLGEFSERQKPVLLDLPTAAGP